MQDLTPKCVTSALNLKLLFRLALAAYVLSVTTVMVQVLLLGPPKLPEAAIAYLNWWAQQPQSRLEQVVGWVSLAASLTTIVAAIGMALFAPWARIFFVTAIGVLIGSEPLMDYPVLNTPIEHFFNSIAGAASGAIIAMSYWSGLANEFFRPAP